MPDKKLSRAREARERSDPRTKAELVDELRVLRLEVEDREAEVLNLQDRLRRQTQTSDHQMRLVLDRAHRVFEHLKSYVGTGGIDFMEYARSIKQGTAPPPSMILPHLPRDIEDLS